MSAAPTIPKKAPWLDRAGRWSWLKAVTFAALFIPGVWIGVSWTLGLLGPKPVTEAIHGMGVWAVRFLMLSLAITPLRRLAQVNRLILVRRMLGIAVLAYLLIHFTLYALSLRFDLVHVASEIALRIYLTIGFVALVGFCVLGSTSTDAMIRRIGPERWNRLHQIVYVLTVLGLLHFFMQAKLDVTQPTLMAGLFLLLMGHRLLVRFRLGDHPVALIGLALACGVLTAFLEAGWYYAARHVPIERVLGANLDFSNALRPAWWVLLAGLALLAVRVMRRLWSRKPQGTAPRRQARAAA